MLLFKLIFPKLDESQQTEAGFNIFWTSTSFQTTIVSFLPFIHFSLVHSCSVWHLFRGKIFVQNYIAERIEKEKIATPGVIRTQYLGTFRHKLSHCTSTPGHHQSCSVSLQPLPYSNGLALRSVFEKCQLYVSQLYLLPIEINTVKNLISASGHKESPILGQNPKVRHHSLFHEQCQVFERGLVEK